MDTVPNITFSAFRQIFEPHFWNKISVKNFRQNVLKFLKLVKFETGQISENWANLKLVKFETGQIFETGQTWKLVKFLKLADLNWILNVVECSIQ